MIARWLTLVVMWRTGFWHGRWGTLVLAATALLLGLTTILLAPSVVVVAVGLVVFGVGMGLTYYATLYYSLAVGHAEVDAGGTFEALIGAGYFAGPLLGIAPAAAAPAHAGFATVALIWLAAAGGAAGGIRPYLAARRARISAAMSRKPS
jgi:hypothetical protein